MNEVRTYETTTDQKMESKGRFFSVYAVPVWPAFATTQEDFIKNKSGFNSRTAEEGRCAIDYELGLCGNYICALCGSGLRRHATPTIMIRSVERVDKLNTGELANLVSLRKSIVPNDMLPEDKRWVAKTPSRIRSKAVAQAVNHRQDNCSGLTSRVEPPECSSSRRHNRESSTR